VLQARDCCNEAVIDEGPKIRVLNMADNWCVSWVPKSEYWCGWVRTYVE
jgi:hypothetical protein